MINIECHIRDVSHRNMSVNQSPNAGKQIMASYPVKKQMVSAVPARHTQQDRTYN